MDLKLRQQLIRDEGLRLDAYQDSLGFWTIGVGHLLGTHPRMTELTPEEADALLEYDVQIAEEIAQGLLPSWHLISLPRQRAIINMAFNLGPKLGRFLVFLQAVEFQDWLSAGRAMLLSKWAAQVGARATRLRDVILSGVDDPV